MQNKRSSPVRKSISPSRRGASPIGGNNNSKRGEVTETGIKAPFCTFTTGRADHGTNRYTNAIADGSAAQREQIVNDRFAANVQKKWYNFDSAIKVASLERANMAHTMKIINTRARVDTGPPRSLQIMEGDGRIHAASDVSEAHFEAQRQERAKKQQAWRAHHIQWLQMHHDRTNQLRETKGNRTSAAFAMPSAVRDYIKFSEKEMALALQMADDAAAYDSEDDEVLDDDRELERLALHMVTSATPTVVPTRGGGVGGGPSAGHPSSSSQPPLSNSHLVNSRGGVVPTHRQIADVIRPPLKRPQSANAALRLARANGDLDFTGGAGGAAGGGVSMNQSASKLSSASPLSRPASASASRSGGGGAHHHSSNGVTPLTAAHLAQTGGTSAQHTATLSPTTSAVNSNHNNTYSNTNDDALLLGIPNNDAKRRRHLYSPNFRHSNGYRQHGHLPHEMRRELFKAHVKTPFSPPSLRQAEETEAERQRLADAEALRTVPTAKQLYEEERRQERRAKREGIVNGLRAAFDEALMADEEAAAMGMLGGGGSSNGGNNSGSDGEDGSGSSGSGGAPSTARRRLIKKKKKNTNSPAMEVLLTNRYVGATSGSPCVVKGSSGGGGSPSHAANATSLLLRSPSASQQQQRGFPARNAVLMPGNLTPTERRLRSNIMNGPFSTNSSTIAGGVTTSEPHSYSPTRQFHAAHPTILPDAPEVADPTRTEMSPRWRNRLLEHVHNQRRASSSYGFGGVGGGVGGSTTLMGGKGGSNSNHPTNIVRHTLCYELPTRATNTSPPMATFSASRAAARGVGGGTTDMGSSRDDRNANSGLNFIAAGSTTSTAGNAEVPSPSPATAAPTPANAPLSFTSVTTTNHNPSLYHHQQNSFSQRDPLSPPPPLNTYQHAGTSCNTSYTNTNLHNTSLLSSNVGGGGGGLFTPIGPALTSPYGSGGITIEIDDCGASPLGHHHHVGGGGGNSNTNSGAAGRTSSSTSSSGGGGNGNQAMTRRTIAETNGGGSRKPNYSVYANANNSRKAPNTTAMGGGSAASPSRRTSVVFANNSDCGGGGGEGGGEVSSPRSTLASARSHQQDASPATHQHHHAATTPVTATRQQHQQQQPTPSSTNRSAGALEDSPLANYGWTWA